MKLINFHQLSRNEKVTIISEIQKNISLPPASIEKDWWVVKTISLVFQTKTAPNLVFKGGTSLSKAWNIIERFSEDVDLSLSYEFLGFKDNISRTPVSRLRDVSFRYISGEFLTELRQVFKDSGLTGVEIGMIEVESPDQDPVKIAVNYPPVTEIIPYIKPQVVLEIGSRSMREPFTIREFRSFVGDKFEGHLFADAKISIPCVNPERTFLEKLFLLHEEFQRPEEKIRVKGLSRHLYDIFKIWQSGYGRRAIENRVLYRTIVSHRERFTRLSGVDYTSHFPPNLKPIPPRALLEAWETDYNSMREQMIYGEAISFTELISGLQNLADEINQLKI